MKKLIVLMCLALTGVAAAQTPVPHADGPRPHAATDPNRKACVDAMNADGEFAKSIINTLDRQIDARTIAAHEQAAQQIAENEKHVLLSYAAMWLIAAAFVVFLWRRQQVLKGEIEQLRKDLDAAGKS